MNSFVIKSEISVEKLKFQSIAELLFERLSQSSDQTCFIDCTLERKWTKKQVLDSSLNFAYYLINDCNLRKGDVVCFVANNSDTHAMGMVGVLMAGGVYYSLPHRSTEDEIKSNLNKIKPSIIVCLINNYNVITKITQELSFIKKIVLIEKEIESEIQTDFPSVEETFKIERQPNITLPIAGNLDDIAILVMSSGSTGQPKAIIKTNGNYLATVECIHNKELLLLTPNDILLASGFLHLSGQRGLFCAINGGAQLAIVRVDEGLEDVFKNIHKYEITNAFLIPTQLNYLIKNYHKFDKNYLRCLRDVVTGSAPLSADIHQQIVKHYGFKNFRVCYGMSEVGWIAQVPISVSKCLVDCKTVGKLVAGNVQVKIIDDSENSLPANTIGQICTKGDQVTPGYLDNDEENAKLFTCDGFLKSGDIGYYDENNFLYVKNRIKETINVETETGIGRISPPELENILLNHSDVLNAAVVGMKHKEMGEIPVAFVTVIEGSTVTPEELTDYVNSRVNYYKQLRGGVRILDSLPMSPMKKINKFKLKSMAEN